MSDLFDALQQHQKAQDTNLPTRGVIRSIDGSRADVFVPGGTTILRQVQLIGTATAIGQEVVLSWENGIPTAHIVGGASATEAQVSRSRGATGPQGEKGDTGSVSAASAITLTELTETPPLPDAGELNVYARDDHKVYKQQSDGVVQEIGTGAGGSGSPVFARLLTANLTLQDTECLVVSGYLDCGDYDVELNGDAEIQII